MITIVEQSLIDVRVTIEQTRGAAFNEKIDGSSWKCAPQIGEERRRQHHIAQAPQLHDENAPGIAHPRRFHRDDRHSFAYCTNA